MSRVATEHRKAKGWTETDRCHTLKWGDAKGHEQRDENWCPECSDKASRRYKLYRLTTAGGRARLGRNDLLAFVKAFSDTWDGDVDATYRRAAEAMIRRGI